MLRRLHRRPYLHGNLENDAGVRDERRRVLRYDDQERKPDAERRTGAGRVPDRRTSSPS